MEEKKYNFIMLVSIFTFLIIAIGYDSFLKNFDLRIIILFKVLRVAN